MSRHETPLFITRLSVLIFLLEYAQVLRMLGDGRLALQCYDDVARTGLIRGTMRRRVWINTVSQVSVHNYFGDLLLLLICPFITSLFNCRETLY